MWAGILSFTFQYLSTELPNEAFERAFSDRLNCMFELLEDEDIRVWIEKNGQVIKRAQLLSMRFLLLMIGYITILHSLYYTRTGYLVRCIRSIFILVLCSTKIENSGTFKKEPSTMNGGRA